MHRIDIIWSKGKTPVWDGDSLLDISSGSRVDLDGTLHDGRYFTAYPFDRARSIRHNGTLWSVLYHNRGTKALLMKDLNVVRELNRSFYCAGDYDYPIALAIGPAGNALVLHCPNKFNRLEAEDAESGEILAKVETRAMEFHSRLSVSPDSRFVLDCGWFWHPWCGLWIFDLHGWLSGLDLSDGTDWFQGGDNADQYEIDSACFLDSDRVAISTLMPNPGEPPSEGKIGHAQIGVWSISRQTWLSRATLSEPTGVIMSWGERVVAFYGHPKVVDLKSGAIVHRWDDISTGKQIGAIEIGNPSPPQLATDSAHRRFAVSTATGVSVICG